MKKVLLLFFAILISFVLKAQTLGTHLTVNTVILGDSFSVCLDTIPIQIIITNDSAKTADSLFIKHIMSDGVNFTGNFSGAILVDAAISNMPVFFIDSLPSGQTDTIQFTAFPNCDFIRDTIMVIDTTIVNYLFNSNSFFAQFIPSSYNVPFANLLFMDSVINGNINGNIGQDFTRTIIFCNGGAGKIDTVLFTVDLEMEVSLIRFSLPSFSPTDTIPYTKVGNTFTLIITDSLIINSTQNGDSLFEQDECIVIVEDIIVTSCTSSEEPQTDYIASWGCNNQTCQSVETNANVEVKAYEPIIKVTTDTTFTPANYCSTDTGTLNFTYTNTANTFVIPGDAVAADLVVVVRWDANFVNIMDVRIGGASVDTIPGISVSAIIPANTGGDKRDSVLFYDLSAVPSSFSFP